jgi:hypothetical protein
MGVAMSTVQIESLAEIETAIAEALERIERQRRMIGDFQARGYNVRAPMTLLSCLLVNLSTLEKRRREEMQATTVAL